MPAVAQDEKKAAKAKDGDIQMIQVVVREPDADYQGHIPTAWSDAVALAECTRGMSLRTVQYFSLKETLPAGVRWYRELPKGRTSLYRQGVAA